MANGWVPQPGQRLGDWAKRALALAAATALGACAVVVPRAPVDRTPPPPTRIAPPPVDSALPRDTERHRVALLVPLSGPNAGVGQAIANATQLALLDANATTIRITTYDTAPGAAAVASRAIEDGAQLILGPLLADDVRQAAPAARAAGVPILSFSNDAGVAGQDVYVMGYAPAQSIARVVGFARGRGVTSFAGLTPTTLYGERASTAYLRAVEGAGGQVVALQTYPHTPGAVAAAAAKVAAKAPYGAVLVADGGVYAAAAAPALKRGAPAMHLLGTELWNAEAGVAARPGLAGAWYASVSDTLYRQFAAKYRTRFAAAPYRLASLGYDAVLLTIRIARDWRLGTRFPEARLRDADGFSGIDGAFRFGRDGVAERALQVQELRGGAATVVSPAPGGFGK